LKDQAGQPGTFHNNVDPKSGNEFVTEVIGAYGIGFQEKEKAERAVVSVRRAACRYMGSSINKFCCATHRSIKCFHKSGGEKIAEVFDKFNSVECDSHDDFYKIASGV